MKVLDLLSFLHEKDIKIHVVDGQLKVTGGKGKINSHILEEIKSNKQELISVLQHISGKSDFQTIKLAEKKEYYPVSSPQLRMYFLQQVDKKNIAYNEFKCCEINSLSLVSLENLKSAISKLVQRHESLRTTFHIFNNTVVQKIHEECVYDVSTNEIDKDNLRNEIDSFVQPFELGQLPLFRVHLVHLSNGKEIIMIDIHHIISDGASANLLISEFLKYYQGNEIPPLKIQYKDYSEWQKHRIISEEFLKQEKYWVEKLSSNLPSLNLETDFPRGQVKGNAGSSITFEVGLDKKRIFENLSHQNGTTLFMTMLSTYYVLLHHYSQQEDIIVGTPIAGRFHADLENLIGMFVNTLPLRNFPRADKTFLELLRDVKETALEAYQNQDYPFDALVQKINMKREMNRNPIFDTILTFEKGRSHAEGIKEATTSVSKFDLSMSFVEREDSFEFTIRYCTDLFKEDTIKKMGRNYLLLLNAIANNPEIKSGEIDILSREEKKSKEAVEYWKMKFQDFEMMNLPTDMPGSATYKVPDKVVVKTFEKALAESVRLLKEREGISLDILLLAVLKVLVFKYTRSENLYIGSRLSSDSLAINNDTAYSYIPVFTKIKDDLTLKKVLQNVKDSACCSYKNYGKGFDQALARLEENKEVNLGILSVILFSVHNETIMVPATISEIHSTNVKPNLILDAFHSSNSLSLQLRFRDDLYQRITVERMLEHFEQVLTCFTSNAEATLNDLSILTEKEHNLLLKDFNNTTINYPLEKSLIDLIEEKAKNHPNAIAVVFQERTITYQELDALTNQLGHYLKELGVKEETLVPICLERSVEMIVGILAILKAGGAYVPIDPTYPSSRIKHIISDTDASIVLCQEKFQNLFASCAEIAHVLSLDVVLNHIKGFPKTAVSRNLRPENAVYVIYTSGSTGQPKGVINENRGVVNRILWAQDYFNLTEYDNVLQKTTFCFDVSVWEFFWPLIAGCKLVFVTPEGHKDPRYLSQVIEKEGITTLHFVPSMLSVFLESIQPGDCKGLKRVLCSGEALTVSQVKSFKEKFGSKVELHNLYGPTEAAVDVSCWSVPDFVEDLTTVPIGKPVANTQLLVLDEKLNLVPIGVPGELFIGGVQVARGYRNLSELTIEKFIVNPFPNDSSSRLYRTGDLAKWNNDGQIQYLGRIDNQVKIRGFRIELEEIENSLSCHPSISDNAVLAKEKQGEKYLVAYYLSQDAISTSEFRNFLEKRLPEYMIPAYFVRLDTIPLTSNGKMDRKFLQKLEDKSSGLSEYRMPRTEIEEILVWLWEESLKVARVGIDDNFFELGGNSLAAMRLAIAIKKEIGLEIPIPVLFEFNSIALLAEWIELENSSSEEVLENFESIKL